MYIYTTCSFQSTSLAKKYTYQWSFRMKRFFETDYFHGWKATSVASLALIRDDAAAYRTKEAKEVWHITIVVNGLYLYISIPPSRSEIAAWCLSAHAWGTPVLGVNPKSPDPLSYPYIYMIPVRGSLPPPPCFSFGGTVQYIEESNIYLCFVVCRLKRGLVTWPNLWVIKRRISYPYQLVEH